MDFALSFFGICLVGAAFIIAAVQMYKLKPEFVKKILGYLLIGGFAVGFSLAAVLIGSRIESRHRTSYYRNLKSVNVIWGGEIHQRAPKFVYKTTVREQYEDPKTKVLRYRQRDIKKSAGFGRQQLRIRVDKNIRRKGLLYFPGFDYSFSGSYLLRNNLKEAADYSFEFQFPRSAGRVSGIQVEFDRKPYTADVNLADGIQWQGRLQPGESHLITVVYRAQGTGTLRYSFTGRKTAIRNLDVRLTAQFDDIEILDGTMLPAGVDRGAEGRNYRWSGKELVTDQDIALKFNVPGNYGQFVAKLFWNAPFAIFLFLLVLTVLIKGRQLQLHVMHFLLLTASFFSFYLLGSYLVSYLPVIPALLISLAVSSGMMVYYAFLLKRDKLLIKAVAAAAFVFQWIYSLAFLSPAHAGLIITLTVVGSLAVLLKLTAGVNWQNKW